MELLVLVWDGVMDMYCFVTGLETGLAWKGLAWKDLAWQVILAESCSKSQKIVIFVTVVDYYCPSLDFLYFLYY